MSSDFLSRVTRSPRRSMKSASIKEDSTSQGVDLDAVYNGADSGSIQSSCSVKAVHDVISRFGERKRQLIESIGFGGLLRFPHLKSTNRKFSAWLMGRVNSRDSSLYLQGGVSLKFYSVDLSFVFGIPGCGRNIIDTVHFDKDIKEKVKRLCWPNAAKDNQSIKAIEELINNTCDELMTTQQENAFKIAFIIFVMSTIFVPGAKHDYACIEYWAALSDPSSIHEYDWAAYIHKKLLTAANKYKTDVAKGSRTPIVTGCYLFLQIFYLDNMDIPVWGVDHTHQPRVSVFTYERIRNMISADTHDRTCDTSGGTYGKCKVRCRENSSYTWAAVAVDQPMDSYAKAASSLWQAMLSIITIMKLPLEAAGPLFVAISELNRPSDASTPPSPIDCVAILLKILEPFRKGFNYNFDIHQHNNDLEAEDGACKIPEIILRYCASTDYSNEINSGISCNSAASSSRGNRPSTDEMPYTVAQPPTIFEYCGDVPIPKRPRLSPYTASAESMGAVSQPKAGPIDYSVIKLMSRFYLLLRTARERNRMDLNNASLDRVGCSNKTAYDGLNNLGTAKTPWELGDTWLTDTTVALSSPADDIRCACSAAVSSLEMPRIMDFHPKYIEVLPGPATDQRSGLLELDMDMFDAIIRCFRRSDDAMYRSQGRLRWRHYFESDILAAILAGWFDITNPGIRNQFIGAHLAYDISKCCMLFFPVIFHERWVCFSWNLRENMIIVFDPACLNIPGFSVRSTYTQVADMLKKTLTSTIPVMLPSWRHDWSAASVVPFHWRSAGKPRSNRTGVLTAYFCRCFDGKKLRPEITQEHTEGIALKVFDEIAALHTARLEPVTS